MFSKIKNFFSIIGVAALAVVGFLGFIFIGRRSDGDSGSFDDCEDRVDNLESGINNSIGRTDRIESGINGASELAGSISDRNNGIKQRINGSIKSNNAAIDGINSAQEILSGGKD